MRISEAIFLVGAMLIVAPLYLFAVAAALLFFTVGGWIVLITAAIITIGVAQ